MSKEIDTNHHMIVFKGKNIRRVLHNDEWWFVVKDIVEALIDTTNSTDYIKKRECAILLFLKGGDKLSPPFLLKHLVANKI